MAGQSVAEPFADLAVHLLGPPIVEWAGRSLAIPRRQTRALLYYLATTLQPAPRGHLCWLFWPDIPEATARRNLSHLLTHLRRALPASEVLLVADDRVGLDPNRAWSDTMALTKLCTSGGPNHRIEAHQRGVDLYRGAFLSGFSLPTSPEFENWATLEQTTWERMHLETLAALVEEKMAQDNYQAAIEYAHRYLAVDDLAEEMHRHLITLYAAVGDRSAATRQFEQCTVALERERGVSPLPETRTAYQATLKGQPSVPQPRAPSPVWATLPSLDVPLIGRDGALRCLETVYADVCVGQGKVVLISGEAGIGKSRLMQEFATRLTSEAIVVVGGGHEAEQNLPFWPLVEALRPHLPDLGRVMPNMAPAYLAELARLWPELRRLLADLPVQAHLEPDQERGRLFEALGSWLLGLAVQRSPLVLCLDDLHWADEATLSWLGYLARRLASAPLLVLGTYSSEEMGVVETLREELMRLGVLQEIRLDGLSQPQILHLIRNLSNQMGETERLSQRLHQVTGGNPFFLLETLRAMFEAGTLGKDGTGWSAGLNGAAEDHRRLPLPATVREAIRARLRRLSPRARQVLEAGAVVGPRFSFDLAWVASGRRQTETVEALDELLARQVIAERDDGYRFNHELIHTVVYRDLSYGRRQLLHRRAGDALQRRQPDPVLPRTVRIL